jgi:hypothetical protein
MRWFQHPTNAHDDPFLYDLVKAMGPKGYAIFFRTLEIYYREFRPTPGWFLQLSFDYWKRKTGIYHKKVLMQFIDFVTTWRVMDTTLNDQFGDDAESISRSYWDDLQAESKDNSKISKRLSKDNSKISKRLSKDNSKIMRFNRLSFDNLCTIFGKWFVNLSGNRVSIFIPNALKYMDRYTKDTMRQNGHFWTDTDQKPASGLPIQDKTADQNIKKDKQGAPVMQMLIDICSRVDAAGIEPGTGFPVRQFIIKGLRDGVQPHALRDGLEFLLKCWKEPGSQVENPWGLALSTARSCQQNYADTGIDPLNIAAQYGPYLISTQPN